SNRVSEGPLLRAVPLSFSTQNGDTSSRSGPNNLQCPPFSALCQTEPQNREESSRTAAHGRNGGTRPCQRGCAAQAKPVVQAPADGNDMGVTSSPLRRP